MCRLRTSVAGAAGTYAGIGIGMRVRDVGVHGIYMAYCMQCKADLGIDSKRLVKHTFIVMRLMCMNRKYWHCELGSYKL